MSLIDLLLIVHLLAAMAWIGGAFVGTLIGLQLRKLGNVDAMARFCASFATVAGPLFGGAGLVVLLSGLGLVGKGYASFDDLWVGLAFLGWIVSMVIGASLAGRNWFRVGQELAAEGATFEAVAPRMSKALLWTWIDLGLRVLIVVDMVWRPT
ncbi:MAG: hypothetical protein JWN72_305 [Thermoleophilia bacterium]|nr:hypothetical protein [Thermoleophilia bacterium]